ncbi:MAG TPA: hypothetical protein VFA71_09665 [Terriglobales bacterium]|nr:hypothetical protein [Terriglobales bacterium]
MKPITAIVTNLTPEQKLAVLEQVLQSTTFARAEQLRNFLRYICEMEIAGRAGELCEFTVGTEALRRPNYSTLEDGIVRRQAIHLREKLQEVYKTELADARFRIDLPKGKYIPRFTCVESYIPRSHGHSRAFWVLTCLAIWALVASMVALALLFTRSSPAAASSPEATLPPVIESGTSYEAEAKGNILIGGAEVRDCPRCSGGSRVRHIGNNVGNYVLFKDVTVPKSGDYEMVIFYVLSGNRDFFVSVNDGAEIQLPLTGQSWAAPAKTSITIPLKAGSNQIKFYNPTTWAPDLDRIVIR